ncbi:Hypothetical predicted protein [Pelobates cultripes]|uniref:Uncharacterized protein n=1 Tax=Pelobates cultripes TaxID=61616 RepID=A0AAD1W807_PELCU|nr:Hypothetical predicted protein [Pelobates cultripes]
MAASQNAEEQSVDLPESSAAQPTTGTSASRDKHTPATKQDITDLLQEMRQMHAADLDLLKTEIQAVTARTQASEKDILDLQQKVQGLQEHVHKLQASQSTLTTRVDVAEDRNRWTNITITGIPDNIDSTELPLSQTPHSYTPTTSSSEKNDAGRLLSIPKPYTSTTHCFSGYHHKVPLCNRQNKVSHCSPRKDPTCLRIIPTNLLT